MAEGNGELSMESLSDVLEGIYEASSKWYNLGLRLGLLASVLDAISTRCLQDPEVCLREMLKEWLKRNPQTTTWKVLIRALESTAVGELVLAKHLKTKHCQQDPDQEEDAMPSTPRRSEELECSTEDAIKDGEISPDVFRKAYSASNSDQHSSDTSNLKDQFMILQAYGCGCGKCSLNTFLNQGCPEPVKSRSSFPYLNTKGLNESEVMILKGRLFHEFQLISRGFSKFNTAICESLINRDVSVKTLARSLRDLRAFQPSGPDTDSPLLRERFDEIKAAKDIDDIFDILADYVSFFSFHITEHIVDNLGTQEDRQLLNQYKKELEEYCKRNIYECPSYSAPKPGVADLMLKVEGIEKYNLKHLAELISCISRVVSVADYTLQLCSVEKGCVQLNFQIPHFVKEAIFPLASEQMEKLKDMDIILVQCSKWQYKLSENYKPDSKVKDTSNSAKVCVGETTQRLDSVPTFTGEGPKSVPHLILTNTENKSISDHGRISREVSEQRLKSVGYDCFLIRESEKVKDCLVLSVKQKGKLSHVLINRTKDGFVARGEVTPFPRIESLILHVTNYLPPCPAPNASEGDSKTLEPQRNSQQASSQDASVGEATLSDYGSDYSIDESGENTGDWSGTGDSAVVLGNKLFPPLLPPPKHAANLYEKLQMDKRDKEHHYSKIRKEEMYETYIDITDAIKQKTEESREQEKKKTTTSPPKGNIYVKI